ncbi:hypothetical protein [Larsenimonas salina]|uniref:hypothetical protein n=1 Tax=Larsenimonas salina TaxID=1295565 RepID=UPI002072AA87|nr:hypothetical protein [Larsenimonas salina]MCM5705414.1 hypothetical protein [Larsenimonas salina]
MTDDPSLPARVRALLERAPVDQLPMTYRQLAGALSLTPPRTIQRVASALEALMRDDARAHQPFIASLVVSQRGHGLPADGFFELAVALGRFPADPQKQREAWENEYAKAIGARP